MYAHSVITILEVNMKLIFSFVIYLLTNIVTIDYYRENKTDTILCVRVCVCGGGGGSAKNVTNNQFCE